MPERRVELILRLPNLTPARANTLRAAVLERLARTWGGSLTRIERDHYPDHAMHVSRKKVV